MEHWVCGNDAFGNADKDDHDGEAEKEYNDDDADIKVWQEVLSSQEGDGQP